MEVGDILGFGKASEKLIDVVSKGIGAVYRPIGIRREAAAKADEIRMLGAAKTEAQAEKIRVIGLADAENKLLATDIDTEILERAKARIVAREVQRQENIENIAQLALKELPDEVSEDPVEDNWRVRFFSIAEDVTDSDMQALWGKVLAGEVAKPGRYSLRTLEILRNISKSEAEMFQRACCLACNGGWIIKVEDTTPRDADFFLPETPSSDFKNFGLSYDDILTLRAAGLLSSGDGLSKLLPPPTPSTTQKHRVRLRNNGITLVVEFGADADASLPVIAFTPAGRELAHLIPNSPNLEYLGRVAQGLRARNVEMYKAKAIGGVEQPDQWEGL